MNPKIKAIETVHSGYRFRSRLEARWAVYFEQMAIEYRYEPEGYLMPDGTKYLPDFFLPKFKLFVEVKPNEEVPLQAWKKMILFASDGDMQTLLFVGVPGSHCIYLLDRSSLCSWIEYEHHTEQDVLSDEIFDSLKEWSEVDFGTIPMQAGWHLIYKAEPPNAHCERGLAESYARQARFEHGQNGAPKK